MGRGKAYTDAQILVVKAERQAGLGVRKILKKHPGLGFMKRGLENIFEKLKADPEGGAKRAEGSGRKPEKRTPANILKVKECHRQGQGEDVRQENHGRI